MAIRYPKSESQGKASILGSSFEAILFPVSSEEEFAACLAKMKKLHGKAAHIPYAFRLDGLARSSDDGEPASTAGKPMLTLLEQKEIDHCALVVARYFGGTKLGMPRLRRSFLQAAEEALAKAEYLTPVRLHCFRLTLSYGEYENLRVLASRRGYRILEPLFDVSVTLVLAGDDTILSAWESLGLAKAEKTQLEDRIVLEGEEHD